MYIYLCKKKIIRVNNAYVFTYFIFCIKNTNIALQRLHIGLADKNLLIKNQFHKQYSIQSIELVQ